MQVAFIEIQNFRKLKAVRVDFNDKETILVGANNSGKTSAMVALGHFLIEKEHKLFNINDFTASNWNKLQEIGEKWEKESKKPNPKKPTILDWDDILPSLDVWLNVSSNEAYHVIHLLPTLDWTEGKIGARLRFEPAKIEELYKDYITARNAANELVKAAKKEKESYELDLWPTGMVDFLEKRLARGIFNVKAYILDETKIEPPDNGIAKPQKLLDINEALEEPPFRGLIKIDKIDAHRGFSNLTSQTYDESSDSFKYNDKGKLSEQLRSYYKKHIDPAEIPDLSDIDALKAIDTAQKEFNKKLKEGFADKFAELEDLGYPGITDPKLEISTKVRPIEGLNHPSALKYSIPSNPSNDNPSNKLPGLPEHSNGLGYQNLISMVFRLMSFRDDWMKTGKIGQKATQETDKELLFPPLHLVLVEEPEAHLHAQVQQVFIRKAYDVLRNHADLRNNKNLCTQLIVSTHSSYIAHECKFSCLRYFRRRPALKANDVPISTVANLSEVFGKNDETERFVTRYIKATHCDLFFADAAIIVEGPAERMLLPCFIENNFKDLYSSYTTILEIGGSHAHRFKSLIEHLGLITLVITDLDASRDGSKALPARNQNLVTGNQTLKTWVPKKEKLDDLFTLQENEKIVKVDDFSSVYSAYQCPIKLALNKDNKEGEIFASTFEDALVFENLDIFKRADGIGLVKKFKTAIIKSTSLEELQEKAFKALEGKNCKAEFALDMLEVATLDTLKVPQYINAGLSWLQEQVKNKNFCEVLSDNAIGDISDQTTKAG